MNYIFQYYQKIEDGEITAGQFIRLWYKQIVNGLEKKEYNLDQKKASKAIRYIENFCQHHEGALAPGLIHLELWQKAMVSVIFGIVDDDGIRIFREVFIVIARKNGKTLFGAAIASYMTYIEPDYGKRIYFCAPKLQQASLCFDAYYQMIKMEPDLDAITRKRRTDIYIEKTDTSAMPLAFNAKRSDGLNPSLVVCDEVSSWHADAGLKQYEVLKSAMGARRQPMLLSISTAGYESEGIYDELMKRSTAVLLGNSKEKRLAPFLYMIDDAEKWNDINELQKSNPNLGVSVTVDYLLEEIAVAEGSLSKKAEFLTKYCNLKQNSSQAWLSAQTIARTESEHLTPEMFRGCYCVGGIDLSQTTDLTACCAMIELGGDIYELCQFFLPAEKLEEATARDGLPYAAYVQRGILKLSGDNFVDYHDCMKWFVDLVEQYKILPLEIGYDRYSAQYLVQDMKAYGFHMDDVYQGENLTPVIRETEGLMKDGRIRIGDNDLLRIHFLDSALKQNNETARVKLIKMRAMAHIDGMAATLDAMCVRQKYHDEIGPMLENKGKELKNGTA